MIATPYVKSSHESTGLDLLKEFIIQKQLRRHNFYQLDELLAIAANDCQKLGISKEEIIRLNQYFDVEFLENTLHGRGFLKPNGYPGDYLFLDKLYTNHISSDPKYALWDEYVQQNGAPDAVRNRKKYFKHLVKSKAQSNNQTNVLNIISGSGRELFELYNENPTANIHTTCVEIDEEAIAFSKNLNEHHQQNIAYVNSNIFRYQSANTYDIIWSAGLFDYLNDKAFTRVLKSFKNWINKGGEIIIGNFNEGFSPSRSYMEVLGHWNLIHRTEAALLQLAEDAGFESRQVEIKRMPDNMILYLHIYID